VTLDGSGYDDVIFFRLAQVQCVSCERPVISDQVEGRRGLAHRAKEAGDLPAVVSSVIDEVQHDLPDRLRIRAALHVRVGYDARGVGIGEIAQPLLPAFPKGGPFGLKQREVAIRGIDEGGARFGSDAREPDAIGRVDVDERVEDCFVGGLEVAREFVAGELGGGGE